MKILKFGGSSVSNAERITNVVKIISQALKSDSRVAVVVSALGGVTDELISLSTLAAKGSDEYRAGLEKIKLRHCDAARALAPKQSATLLDNINGLIAQLANILRGISLVRECSLRTKDQVLSFGERLSAVIVAHALCEHGINAQAADAALLVKTDGTFGNARVLLAESSLNIQRHFKEHTGLQIVTGFIGSTAGGEITTLGRGGSDFTASIFAYALDAAEVKIWTDVDGMLTCDPRKVPKAFPLPHISYEEAMELCHFGAKVIYPPTLQPARDKEIPVRICNTFNPDFPGTVISNEPTPARFMITGISSISRVALLRVQGSGMVGVTGTSMRLFGALATNAINVILITQASSEHTICFAVDPHNAVLAKEVLEREFALEIKANLIDPVSVEEDLSIVSVVGDNMRHRPGIAGKLFAALGRNGVNVVAIAQGSSERNISFVTFAADERKALNAIHDEFFLSDARSLNLFLVGPGLIGKTLLTQLAKQHRHLLRDMALDVRIVGLSNSKSMLLDERGINAATALSSLASKGVSESVAEFVSKMCALNLPNCVFADCTASEDVVREYGRILESSISVVTPNKKAQSGSLQVFQNLKEIAKRRGVHLLYETSVGAGLPIIGTLQDLLRSGDTVVAIEGVFSGTLSFLFNSFDGSKPFSALLKEAQQLGYTEADPRDDLNGLDVARKLLILAREAGLPLELNEVAVENLVPESCRNAASVEEFYTRLAGSDEGLEKRRVAVVQAGRKLCYVGTVKDGKARVALMELEKTHPFSALSGSDNIISFTTARYLERPLVVRGPGAGAEVTAAGVFADIIRAGS